MLTGEGFSCVLHSLAKKMWAENVKSRLAGTKVPRISNVRSRETFDQGTVDRGRLFIRARTFLPGPEKKNGRSRFYCIFLVNIGVLDKCLKQTSV